jgi:hypothetical protein
MPLVVVHRENKFNEVLKQMRRSGGGRANAYPRIRFCYPRPSAKSAVKV